MAKINTEHGIFTDLVNDSGELIKEAKDVYAEYLKQIQIDISNTTKSNEELTKENEKLKAQLEASVQNQEFVEACLMEMAQIVYA